MTSAFKEYVNIENSLKRLSYKSFLDISREMVEYHLEFSLMFDGRYYGAEWHYHDLEELDGILAPYLTGEYIDPVKVVREIRNPDESYRD